MVRTVFGIAGVLLGAAIAFLGFFGAGYMQSQPDWSGEPSVLLILGISVVVAVPAAAIRPTRLTIAIAALVLLAVPITGTVI